MLLHQVFKSTQLGTIYSVTMKQQQLWDLNPRRLVSQRFEPASLPTEPSDPTTVRKPATLLSYSLKLVHPLDILLTSSSLMTSRISKIKVSASPFNLVVCIVSANCIPVRRYTIWKLNMKILPGDSKGGTAHKRPFLRGELLSCHQGSTYGTETRMCNKM